MIFPEFKFEEGTKHMKKKVLAMLLAAVLAVGLLSLSACENDTTAGEETNPPAETTAQPTSTPEPTLTPTSTPTPDPAGGDPFSYINLTISEGNYYDVDEPITITLHYPWEDQVDLNGYSVLSQDTQLTVSNLAGADENCFILIYLYECYKNQDGSYNTRAEGVGYYLTDSGKFRVTSADLEAEFGESLVELRPGESVTFSIFGYEADLLLLTPALIYPTTDSDQRWPADYGFVYG